MATPILAGAGLLHVVVPVADLSAACAFYDPLLALAGLRRQVTGLDSAGYGQGQTPTFWLRQAGSAVNADRFSRVALAVRSRDALTQAQHLVVASGLSVVVPPSRQPMHGEQAWGLELVDADGNRLTLVDAGAHEPGGGRRDRFADSGHGESPDYPNP